MIESLDTQIRYLKGVGEAREKLLAKLGIFTVADLLGHFPRRYEDRSVFRTIAELHPGETGSVRARVISAPSARRIPGGRLLTRLTVADDTASMPLTFFNSPYLKLYEGETYDFYGRADLYGTHISMINPVCEPTGSRKKTGRIYPVYDLTAGLSNPGFVRWLDEALEFADIAPETLPAEVLEANDLLPIGEAYRQIHHPENAEKLDLARRRFAFEELFYLSLGYAGIRASRTEPGAKIPTPDMQQFYGILPYAPTGAQARAIDEILSDMADTSTPAMRRMVQGDVGSGKTLVAAAAAFAVIRAGFQAAMMAPTEILAAQHYHDLSALFAPLGIRTGLISAGMRAVERREMQEKLSSGEIQFVVGTHALLSQTTVFKALRLVITDEQHRFGVRQRAMLREKADELSHMLVMSATPIPRTLAMVIYGDMDLSVIDELPPGRIPVDTRAPEEDKRSAVYGFLRRQVLSGRQGYVVCPLIEEGEDDGMKSVETFAKSLKKEYFPDFPVELMHGKLPPKEKDAIMQRFAAGEIKVLVSTTVIEVGVNVPNANMIVIENAERFGLSQLHQLRGRVGRSTHKSYCVLLSSSHSAATQARLKVLCSTNDGFAIAREDLRLRGPGEFFGERQSGVPGLKVADLGADMQLLSAADNAAKTLSAADPEFKAPGHAMIAKKLAKMFKE